MEPSRPSATPLRNGTGAAVAGGGEPPYDGGMEHRMTTIETRLDTILPTLATKSDVAALRADMEKADLSLNAKFDAKFEELRVEIQQVELRMNAKFDAKYDSLRAEIQQVELRMNAKFDAGFDSLRAEMLKLNADVKTWALATMIAIIGVILAGIIGISQLYRNSMPRATAAPISITIPGALARAPPAAPA